ncbi:MAG: hypothetical protein DAHOPDDO_02977 [Ignavibacteriaceae bacterium]|jgi:hypothetical protein|uniref:hypothetical protein n=1 Tax=Ignavibacterium album TaxID=591197 RepID=UPI0018433B97|nr:hypothetical protein [Ignavibacteriaceae bacterium]MBV6421696.1 hypothetical protein [Ignavibacteriaceae bacterium]NUM42890.1 hypothetical protein [Leptospiraceae bacterium]
MDINNFRKWETPVSDAQSLVMVSLFDKKNLEIILQDLRDSNQKRFKFIFRNVAAYKNILEEYRTSETKSLNRNTFGWTIVSDDSEWLNYFKEKEPLLEEYNPNCKHFIIITENDVVEILCSNFPEIIEIEPAKEDEDLPGKATIYYHPEDRKEIDRIIDEIKKESKKSG